MNSLPSLAVWEDAKRNGGKIMVCPENFKFNIGKKGGNKKHQKEMQNIVSNYHNVSIDQYISYIVKFYNMKLDGNNYVKFSMIIIY